MTQGQYSPPPSPTPQQKRHINLEAHNVTGHIQGLAQAHLVAVARDSDGMGVGELDIHFLAKSTREHIGTVSTTSDGEAALESGSSISNPELMFSAATSGFVAKFYGNRDYYPAEANGRIGIGA